MYYNKLKIIMAILLALLGFATVKMKAEIPILQADTVFAGFGGGSVSGIVFTSDPDKVILMHGTTPTEIDIKTHQVVREFEAVPNIKDVGSWFFIDNVKNIVGASLTSSEIMGIKDFSGMAIWDIVTGRIIKAIPGVILQNVDDLYYTYFYNDTQTIKYIGRYDINTFRMIDSIYLPEELPGIGSAIWGAIGIIPNSNKVLVGVDRYIETKDQYGNWKKEYYLAELYLLDFDTKQYSKIPIPSLDGKSSSQIYKITISNSAKYYVVSIKYDPNGETYYYFFDSNINFLYYEYSRGIAQKLQISNFQMSTNVYFMDDRYVFIPCLRNDISNELIYDLDGRSITSIIDFFGGDRISYALNKIALSNYKGVIGLLDKFVVSVNDGNEIHNCIQSIQYQNNNLIINSTSSEEVDINITDYRGNLLQSQQDVYLHNGTNTVKINIPLGNGVYFCVIKSANDSNSFKFMVSK